MYYITAFFLVLTLLPTPSIATEDQPTPAAVSAQATTGQASVGAEETTQAEPLPSATGAPAVHTEADAVMKSDEDASGKDAPKKRYRTGLTPDPNRRWIMKQPKYENKKSEWLSDKPVEWEGAAQELRCREYKKELNREYNNARYYSIQGDRCKTATYSAAFLAIVDKCKAGCPDTFLESAGFDGHFIRNMQQLKALGNESCLDEKSPPTAGSTTSTEEN